MDQTIKIFSRKKFRFSNPEVKILGFNDTGLSNKQPDFEKAYFETIPDTIQDAPVWIKQDRMFEWATKDGDLMEITVPVAANATEKQKDQAVAATEAAIRDVQEAAQRGVEGLEGEQQEEQQEDAPRSKGKKK